LETLGYRNSQVGNTIPTRKRPFRLPKDEGIVFKIIYNRIEEDGTFLLCSTNSLYQPYPLKVQDILEIWKFVNYINPKFEEPQQSDNDNVGPTLRMIQREIGFIKDKVKNIEDKI
jgi:hypothetical protein